MDRFYAKTPRHAYDPRAVDTEVYGHFVMTAQGDIDLWEFKLEKGRNKFVAGRIDAEATSLTPAAATISPTNSDLAVDDGYPMHGNIYFFWDRK